MDIARTPKHIHQLNIVPSNKASTNLYLNSKTHPPHIVVILNMIIAEYFSPKISLHSATEFCIEIINPEKEIS